MDLSHSSNNNEIVDIGGDAIDVDPSFILTTIVPLYNHADESNNNEESDNLMEMLNTVLRSNAFLNALLTTKKERYINAYVIDKRDFFSVYAYYKRPIDGKDGKTTLHINGNNIFLDHIPSIRYYPDQLSDFDHFLISYKDCSIFTKRCYFEALKCLYFKRFEGGLYIPNQIICNNILPFLSEYRHMELGRDSFLPYDFEHVQMEFDDKYKKSFLMDRSMKVDRDSMIFVIGQNVLYRNGNIDNIYLTYSIYRNSFCYPIYTFGVGPDGGGHYVQNQIVATQVLDHSYCGEI